MKYHIWTIGCQMNTADSQRLAAQIERLGYDWTDVAEDADVVVLNTCVVRQQAEDKVMGRLSSLAPVKAERPDAVIALMGCLVGPKPAAALRKKFPMVDVFIPPSETAPLVDALRARALEDSARRLEEARVTEQWSAQDAPPAGYSHGDGAPPRPRGRDEHAEPGSVEAARLPWTLPVRDRGLVTAHVPIVYGCNWVCTFCIIPSRRGAERSRPTAEIVAEVRNLAAQGVREVTLLGQIVDRFGWDRGEPDGLVDLLRELDAIEDLHRIRFLTSHPKFMTDAILDEVAALPKVMEHIEVPIQAGHDRTLERMKRGYTVAEYYALVERIRSRIPNVAIHTDVIVGFPGETETEFEGTARVLRELRFDKVHLAKFSSRPGTVAAKVMADDVSPEEKENRRAALDSIQEGVSTGINARHMGRTVQVLVDGRDRDRWRGRTRTNKIVYFEHPAPVLGELVDVEISWTGPWSMIGTSRAARPLARNEILALTPT